MKSRFLKWLILFIVVSISVFSFVGCGECKHNYINYKCQNCGNEIYTEGLHYILNSEKTEYSLAGVGIAEEREIIIPSLYKGLPITSIEDNAFNNNNGKRITKLFISNSIKTIGGSAFEQCEDLEVLTIGEGVISIGDFAFKGCTNLKEINFDSNEFNINNSSGVFADAGLEGVTINFGNLVKNTPSNLFSNVNVISINLCESVLKISDFSFNGCKNLKEIIIPNSVSEIGASSFYGCSELSRITIGNGVKAICEDAFRWCTKLYTINYNGSKQEWRQINKKTYCFGKEIEYHGVGMPDVGSKVLATKVACKDGGIDLLAN